jgi:hypothetical protein
MRRDEACRELARLRTHCGRCDEMRDLVTGVITHRDNCPLIVALRPEMEREQPERVSCDGKRVVPD